MRIPRSIIASGILIATLTLSACAATPPTPVVENTVDYQYEYAHYDSLSELCAAASLVVTAIAGDTEERFYDSKGEVEVEDMSTNPASSTAYRIERVTTLNVTAVHKGKDVIASGELEVAQPGFKESDFPLKPGIDYVLFFKRSSEPEPPFSLLNPTQSAYELAADGSLIANASGDNILPNDPVHADETLCAGS